MKLTFFEHQRGAKDEIFGNVVQVNMAPVTVLSSQASWVIAKNSCLTVTNILLR